MASHEDFDTNLKFFFLNFIAFGSSSTLTSFFKKYISDHTQEEKSWKYSSKYNQITSRTYN